MRPTASKLQTSLQLAIEQKRLGNNARMHVIKRLATDLHVQNAFVFDTADWNEPTPYEVEALRQQLVAAVEQCKAGREQRIHLVKTLFTRLGCWHGMAV
jgi:hypothetical protein